MSLSAKTAQMIEPPVFYVMGRVVRLQTKTGLKLKDSVKIGDRFLIDIYTRTTGVFSVDNRPTVVEGMMQCVEDGGWVPWECLEHDLSGRVECKE